LNRWQILALAWRIGVMGAAVALAWYLRTVVRSGVLRVPYPTGGYQVIERRVQPARFWRAVTFFAVIDLFWAAMAIFFHGR
jgi:heme/copper-type cytochrome/quinol oxidase subunit 1